MDNFRGPSTRHFCCSSSIITQTFYYLVEAVWSWLRFRFIKDQLCPRLSALRGEALEVQKSAIFCCLAWWCCLVPEEWCLLVHKAFLDDLHKQYVGMSLLSTIFENTWLIPFSSWNYSSCPQPHYPNLWWYTQDDAKVESLRFHGFERILFPLVEVTRFYFLNF